VTTYDGVVASVNPTVVKTGQAVSSGGGVTIMLKDGDEAFMTVHRIPVPPGQNCLYCP
jgi:hypothetical protein